MRSSEPEGSTRVKVPLTRCRIVRMRNRVYEVKDRNVEATEVLNRSIGHDIIPSLGYVTTMILGEGVCICESRSLVTKLVGGDTD